MPVSAQSECPTLERAALAETAIWCAEVPDGHACYGNATLTPTWRDATTTPGFQNSGDVVALDEWNALIGISERATNQWGVAYLRPITHRPDSWQPRTLTIILMGDVTLTNQGEDGVTLPTRFATITPSAGANLRRTPSEQAPIVATVARDEVVKLTGITADESWVRLQRLDGQSAWLTTTAIDLPNPAELPTVTADDVPPDTLYQPFSDLRLQTRGETPCEGAPPDGLLIQSEDDTAGAMLRINDLNLILDGAVFVQADERITQIHVIEGTLIVADQTIVGGQTLRYSQDDTATQAYDVNRLEHLPIHLLPRWFYIAVDTSRYLTPRPSPDASPLAGIAVDDPCRITTGETGSNLRAGAGTNYPIQGVMAHRESARPTGYAIASDGAQWWRIAPFVWVRRDTTVTGGDCASLPQVDSPPPPPLPRGD